MSDTFYILAAAFVLLVGYAGYRLGRSIERMKKLVYELIDALKNNSPKRHTHRTEAGIEDAIAVALDVLQEYQASQKYTEARISQLTDILTITREGPHSYDPDRPNGKKKHDQ